MADRPVSAIFSHFRHSAPLATSLDGFARSVRLLAGAMGNETHIQIILKQNWVSPSESLIRDSCKWKKK